MNKKINAAKIHTALSFEFRESFTSIKINFWGRERFFIINKNLSNSCKKFCLWDEVVLIAFRTTEKKSQIILA